MGTRDLLVDKKSRTMAPAVTCVSNFCCDLHHHHQAVHGGEEVNEEGRILSVEGMWEGGRAGKYQSCL